LNESFLEVKCHKAGDIILIHEEIDDFFLIISKIQGGKVRIKVYTHAWSSRAEKV
jgi:hypothetical protein